MKYKNKKCECGFDLSSVEPELYYEIAPGEYIGYCPFCRGMAQPVVEGDPKKSKAEPEPEPEPEPES